MNIIKYEKNNMKCPLCDSTALITDESRSETFCEKCGLVVKDNTFLTPSQVEYMINLEEKTSETFTLDYKNKPKIIKKK